MTSKQRAYLRGLANRMETIFQVGKDGIGEAFEKQVDEALEKRELIKLRTLETAEISSREAAESLALATHSEVVQVIGSRVVLYRASKKAPKIVLPEKAR